MAFFQNKNKKCMKSYKVLIEMEKAKAMIFENEAKSL